VKKVGAFWRRREGGFCNEKGGGVGLGVGGGVGGGGGGGGCAKRK